MRNKIEHGGIIAVISLLFFRQSRYNWQTMRKMNSSKEDYYPADSFEENHKMK